MSAPSVVLNGAAVAVGGRTILGPLDLAASPGEIVGVAGGNGSGKSVLLEAIARGACTSGALTRVSSVALIRQDPGYADEPTIADVLREEKESFGDWDEERASRFIRDIYLPEDRQIWRLSRGMRAAIGMTLAVGASQRLLLIDEPFLGVDLRIASVFGARLRERAEAGTTILVATVRPDLLRGVADRILLLADGVVTRDELATDEVLDSLDF